MSIEKKTPQSDIKVGVVMDQSGPLAPLGTACANTARMVVEDINASGGLLGRPVQLVIEDSETDDHVAGGKAEKLVRQGAPGMRREDLDLRKVELLVKQRLAKERGFVL